MITTHEHTGPIEPPTSMLYRRASTTTHPEATSDATYQVPDTMRVRAAGTNGNTMVGLASPFNVWTRIRSWEGDFWERVAPGAFKKTLAERADRVKVLYDHGFSEVLAGLTLGTPLTVEETPDGLWTETELSRSRLVQEEIKPRLEEGSLDGMSIQFSVVRDQWHNPNEDDDDPGVGELPDDGVPRRTIQEMKLYEYGPVTFPAFEATTVGIRSRAAYQDWIDHRGMLISGDAAHPGTSPTEPPTLALTEIVKQRQRQLTLIRKGVL